MRRKYSEVINTKCNRIVHNRHLYYPLALRRVEGSFTATLLLPFIFIIIRITTTKAHYCQTNTTRDAYRQRSLYMLVTLKTTTTTYNFRLSLSFHLTYFTIKTERTSSMSKQRLSCNPTRCGCNQYNEWMRLLQTSHGLWIPLTNDELYYAVP